jgi:sn-glycerol 3-phosphate transport system substrate-binding protein
MRKTILAAALFVLAASPLFAKKTEITFWHSLGFHVKELIEQMSDEFNKTHPDVQVNPIFQGLYDEMQVKMLASAVTRQLPDVAQVQVEFLEPYLANNLVEPLAVSEEDKADVVGLMWELVSRNGVVYAMPFAISTEVLFYNEDAFVKAGLNPNKPPETWDELIKYGKKLTQDTNGDGEIDRYAMMFWTEGFYGLATFLWDFGGKLFTDDGKKVILTSKEMSATIGLLRDMAFKHRIMPYKWTDWEAGQAFLTGKLAMGIFTSAAISYGEQNLPWKLRIAPVPLVNGKRTTIIGGSCLVSFSRNKKAKKAINEFMVFMNSRENTIKLHEKIGFIPVRQSALNSLELKAFWKENPNFKVPVDALAYARPLPVHADFYKINKTIKAMLQRIFLDGADPAAELSSTEQRINASIN